MKRPNWTLRRDGTERATFRAEVHLSREDWAAMERRVKRGDYPEGADPLAVLREYVRDFPLWLHEDA